MTGFCPTCDNPTAVWHKHHVVGRAQGGGDVAGNLVQVCPACHHYLHTAKQGAEPHRKLVVYCRTLRSDVGEYSDGFKWPGWLEERYLGYGSRSGIG